MKRFPLLIVVLFAVLFTISSFAQWSRVNSPHKSPNITHCFYHHAGYFFAIESDSVFYRSADEGVTWNKISSIPIKAKGKSIITNKEGVIFVPCIDGYYSSTNLGTSWQHKTLNAGHAIAGMTVDTSGSNVFVCENNGTTGVNNSVFKSSDNGNTWINKGNGLNGKSLMGIVCNKQNEFFIITSDAEIFKSTNGGDLWEQIYHFSSDYGSAFSIDGEDNLYATASQVYKSTDHGLSWQIINNGGEVYAGPSGKLYILSLYYFLVSSNGGATWNSISSFYSTINSLFERNGIVYICTDAGLRYGSDLITWQTAFVNVEDYSSIYDLLTINNKVFAASNEGLYISSDNGENWNRTPIIGYIRQLKKDNLNNIFASCDSIIYRSTDLGETWVPVFSHPGLTVGNIAINDSNYIAISVSADNRNKLYFSLDHGNTWSLIISMIPYITEIGGINALALKNNGQIFFPSYYYYVFPHNNELKRPLINKTSIYTTEVTKVRTDLFSYGMDLYDDTLYFASGRFAYVSTVVQGIYASADTCVTIVPLNNGLGIRDMIQVIKIAPDKLLSLDRNHLPFYSVSNGDYWNQCFLWGITGSIIRLRACDDNIYACGINGLFKYDQTVTNLKDVKKDVISSYQLTQNYPNPFNPSTEITFSIPESGQVTLTVFDILGNKVVDLYKGYKPSGSYSVSFNASALSSGVYFYRLSVNNFTSTRKMLLLK